MIQIPTCFHARHALAFVLLGTLLTALFVGSSFAQMSDKKKMGNEGPVTDAERIAQLVRTIEADTQQLQTLQKEMADPSCEYSQAEKNFNELDKKWSQLQKEIADLREQGKKEEAKQLETDNQSLRQQREDAQKRFDLAIQERKTQQELLASLQRKIQEDQQALRKLRGDEQPITTTAPPENPTKGGGETPPVPTPPTKDVPSPTKDEPKSVPPKPPEGEKKKEVEPPTKDAQNQQLTQAKEEAKEKEKAAETAEADVESIEKRLTALRNSTKLDQKLYDTARLKVDQAQKAAETLEKELFSKVGANADEAVIQEVLARLEDARKRANVARGELREIADRLHHREIELEKLLAEQYAARTEADRKRQEAEAARRKVELLQSPFHPENIRLWLYRHGPKLLAIVLAVFLLRFLSRVFSHRVIRVVTHRRVGPRGSGEEKANRTETLVTVFRNFTSMLIFVGGTLMILDEVGVPIIPLLGGAAVLGLAVAFGAQNLIRDYFSGFMVLMEDQYSINDVVNINGVSGTVEYISLRMTVLRDIEGIVHFIPHGILTTVSNMTHGWSRAFFEIGVAYKEDVDRVMRILNDLAMDLRKDPAFGSMIVDDVQMLGVDGFADSAVMIKFFLKTKPLKQWLIKRELLRRIKNRFDELQIEIPFPHRTVYHHHDKEADSDRQAA